MNQIRDVELSGMKDEKLNGKWRVEIAFDEMDYYLFGEAKVELTRVIRKPSDPLPLP